MTGLNLVTFLQLLRTDAAVWTSLAILGSLLGLMVWTSLRARWLLRRCLALSVLLHLGVIATGGQTEWGRRLLGPWELSRSTPPGERLARIEIASESEGGEPGTTEMRRAVGAASMGPDGQMMVGPPLAIWDRPSLKGFQRLDEPETLAMRPEPSQAELIRRTEPTTAVAPEAANPEAAALPAPEPEAVAVAPTNEPPEPMPAMAPAETGELPEVAEVTPTVTAAVDPLGALRATGRPAAAGPVRSGSGTARRVEAPALGVRPELPGGLVPTAPMPSEEAASTRLIDPDGPPLEAPAALAGPATGGELPAGDEAGPVVASTPAPALAMPGRETRPGRTSPVRPGLDRPLRPAPLPLAIARNLPDGAIGRPTLPRAPLAPRSLPDVPDVYRSRLDRNRSQRAQRAGASAASEEAVERALDWLARHQDQDGRWDAATGRDTSGRPVAGEDDFTVHCPAGEVCFGTCHYWEADTATTGLALLAYLGAGYTHREGKHATTVAKGLAFLKGVQKPDGDLRGASRAVGMYCHAMASLALCEAYALTGDPELEDAAARAVRFLVRSRANDGMSWRYAPGAPVGDTSILGWVILVLKSAKEIGFDVPAPVASGAAKWLRLVSSGPDGGLAVYQPGQPVTPTMTAEAWVCRQFLGIGGPGTASDEAGRYVLNHPPSEEFNIYYWYYATLAMYQYGGEPWLRWNAMLRDQLVRRQRTGGHQAGSWDPDDSRWGRYGGRIYSTALATLTLEVYYRYLRLYDEPGHEPVIAPGPEGGPGDEAVRRAGAPRDG